jgi:hypothetical protein
MNELLIAAITIVLLLLIIFKVRKRTHKLPEPAKASQTANKPILNTEPKKEPIPPAKEPLPSTKPDIKPIAESKTNTTVTLPSKDSNENVPQDSMLRRHYLANLRAMIESLTPPRPSESSLRRHYDSLIAAEIEQCINDKGAIERLTCKYEAHTKTLTKQQPPQAKTLAEPLLKAEISNTGPVVQNETPKLPEDSALRRHTITHLKAIAESNK